VLLPPFVGAALPARLRSLRSAALCCAALQIYGLPTLIFVGLDQSKPALRTEGLLPAQVMAGGWDGAGWDDPPGPSRQPYPHTLLRPVLRCPCPH